jgi:two-component system, NtrC family, sensor kinase
MQLPVPSHPPSASPTPFQILVVEDDDQLSGLYRQILSRLGPVRICWTLGQALKAVHERMPDVILLDLGLPDSEDLDGLAQIRKRAPGAAVVITTGASDEELAIQALRNGAQDYLLKGRLDPSSLTRSVRYALERKQAENKLQRSEELFTAITDNMIDLLSIIDIHGARLYTSPSYERLLGYSEEEMSRIGFLELIHPEDRATIQEALEQLYAEGSSRSVEYRLRHKNGAYVFLESNAVRILGTQSEESQAILVARDITARKQAEAERERMEIQLRHAQKLESIGQLAAGIAHEINTPTQYIGDNAIFLREAFKTLGRLVELLQSLLDQHEKGGCTPEDVVAARRIFKDADLDFLLAEIPKAITQTLEGVKRVTRIVGAMKEFSHPGSDTKTRVDLNRAIESTVTVCRNEWKYVADLELDLAPELPFVPCLPGEFNQAILNLVINAVHAIEASQAEGGKAKGLIRIRTRLIGEWVEIQVQDTGCGIPEPIRAKVFDPFFTTKPVGKGTGQGLAIVHSVIVEKHRGSITIESEVGTGTAFILRLPLKEA